MPILKLRGSAALSAFRLEKLNTSLDTAQARLRVVDARFWLDVATRFPDTDEARLAMAGMRPVEPNFDLSSSRNPDTKSMVTSSPPRSRSGSRTPPRST